MAGAFQLPSGADGPDEAGSDLECLAVWLDARLHAERSALEVSHLRLLSEFRSQAGDFCDHGRPAVVGDAFLALEPSAELASPEPLQRKDTPASAPVEAVEKAAQAGARQRHLLPSYAATRMSPRCTSPDSDGPADKDCEMDMRSLWRAPHENFHVRPSNGQTAPTRTASKMSANAQKLRAEKRQHTNTLDWLVNTTQFEVSFAMLILSSAFLMSLEVEYKSVDLAILVGYLGPGGAVPNKDGWPGADEFFKATELMFGIVFACEVGLKIGGMQDRFVFSGWNVFDLLVVVLWIFERTASVDMLVNPMLFRVCRLCRLFRLLRLVKMIEMFDTLVLMIGSIKASVSVLVWGTVLLVTIMMMSAMFLNSMLTPYMEDEAVDVELRLAVYAYFGSFSRCMITMFEVTLGNWVPVCRLLIDNNSELYGLLFLVYKCVVGFAVVKVITGVFLHETFKCAAMDDELMIQGRERSKQKFKDKMLRLVEAADSSGDGCLSLNEFKDIVQEPRVHSWLQAMELNVLDIESTFSYLAGSDQFSTQRITSDTVISPEELCKGVQRLRGGAQEIDLLRLMAQCREIYMAVEAQGDHFNRALADMESRLFDAGALEMTDEPAVL